MVYKILIESKVEPEQPITNQDFSVQLILTNIGESSFPGGEFTSFRIVASNHTQSVNESSLPKISPMKPNEKIELEPDTFRIIPDGIAWIKAGLKANDGEQVDLYQSLETNLKQDWMDAVSIRNQEYVKIISLLEKSVELLERMEKK